MSAVLDARDQGVVKFFDSARNYGIMSSTSTGKDVFLMGKALSPGFTPQARDVLSFELVVKVRSSGTEKLEAANVSLVSRSKVNPCSSDTSSGNTRDNSGSKTDDNRKIDVTSRNITQKRAQKAATVTVTDDPANAKQSTFSSGTKTACSNLNRHSTQKKKQLGKKNPKHKIKTPHKEDAAKSKETKNEMVRSKRRGRNNSRRSNNNINNDKGQSKGNDRETNSDKFAESALFSSPDPSCLPMPGITEDHKAESEKTRCRLLDNFADSALFGSPDPKCLPIPRF